MLISNKYYYEDYTPIKKLLEREIPKAQDYIRPDGTVTKGETIDMLNRSMPILAKMMYEARKDIPIYEGSLRDQSLKGELSYKDELKLYSWVQENYIKDMFFENSLNEDISLEIERIFRSSFSINEFKEKWLEFKEQKDSEFKALKQQNEELIQDDKNLHSNIDPNSKEPNPFTPIQAESKNETYTYDDIAKNFFLTFLENERKKGNDVLELLEKLFTLDKSKIDLKV
ncbi:hypothetical protein [uncultured Campylobacter sp.]|uniref:hypothetical protein n=1 Tax=uncultured Campylobacter sp. TaxID=218934 RepID=UPI00263575EC|nr:hypothetical protein [uncultured Campylobacter sp.]